MSKQNNHMYERIKESLKWHSGFFTVFAITWVSMELLWKVLGL